MSTTRVAVDAVLAREAMLLANVRTRREAVDVALRRFVQYGRQRRLLELHGAGGVGQGYKYKKARSAT